MDKFEAKESFERNWEEFLTRLKGKMLIEKDKNISFDTATMILDSVVKSSWKSNHDILGRWLMNYVKADELKGTLVSKVLLEDMKFESVQQKLKSSKDKLVDSLPWIGAAAGLGMSYYFHFNKTLMTALTILPPVLLPPVLKKAKSEFGSNPIELINEYIGQLEKYKLSIISIMENE